jgi:hypothetical protein
MNTPASITPELSLDDNSEQRSVLIPGLIILPNSQHPFIPCFVVDCCKGQCSLRVNISYTLSQRDVLVRILDANDEQQLELVGRITASSRETLDTTTFRCEFGQNLPPHVVAMLNQLAITDRRDDLRTQCAVQVNVCRIQRGEVISQARMVEASDGGLRLRTEVPLDIGEQVIVRLPDGQDLLVAIVWSAEFNGANQTGGSVTIPTTESSILHSVHRLCNSQHTNS